MRAPLQIVSDHYAASSRQDLNGMLADLSPSCRWTEMAGFPCAGTHIGPQGVLNGVFKVLGSEWDGFTFQLERLVDGGTTIVALGSYIATHTATRKKMQARTAHVWDVSEGKVQAFEQFADTLLVTQAMSNDLYF